MAFLTVVFPTTGAAAAAVDLAFDAIPSRLAFGMSRPMFTTMSSAKPDSRFSAARSLRIWLSRSLNGLTRRISRAIRWLYRKPYPS
jgi:hypothetical protein